MMTRWPSLLLFGLLALPSPTIAAESATPNILLILADDHAQKALSCYGNADIKTPGLDRLAKEGMRFEHALTPNSFCTPARAAVLTGKYSHKNGVTRLNQAFDGSQQTFPKLLRSAGYETALFGKWHLLSQPTGFDHYCVQKMQGMVNDPIVFEPHHPWIPWGPKTRETYRKGGRRLTGYNNDAITTEAINWLKNSRRADTPFCMLLHPKPPHEPYLPPPPGYEDFLADVTLPEPATLLDDYKGRAPELIADKMTPNRIILRSKYKAMIAKDPKLLDFAGLPTPQDMQGYSLKPILTGKAEKVRDASYYHFYSHGVRLPEMIGIRTATHKLIHYPGMEPAQWELFDLGRDPDEMRNQYVHPEFKETREGLEKQLRKLIKDLGAPVTAPGLQ